MNKQLKITFLGTGSALGVPQLGCRCHVCSSPLKANKRRRSCYLIERGGKSFILDPGPDTRFQLLDHPIKKLDGIIITHAHHDHIGGYDELRIYAIKQETVIPTLIHDKNVDELKRRCGYLFKTGYTYFSLQTLSDDEGHGIFETVPFRYFTYMQNGMNVTGFVIDNVAFVSDIQTLDDALTRQLLNVDTLIVSCVLKPSGMHKSHLNLEEIKDLKARTGAQHLIITHMGHDIDFTTITSELDAEFMPSYDGFTYEV